MACRGGRGYLGHQVVRESDLEAGMNEDQFNMEVRKFLKKVGVTSQREIEQAVRDGLESGKLKGHEILRAKVTLTLDGTGLKYDIDGEISLG
jgi:hypothetical protein